MTTKSIIKASEYHDSVSLMSVARELSNMEGVSDASVVMGTDANKALLAQAGLLTPEATTATPIYRSLVVSAPDEVVDAALANAERR